MYMGKVLPFANPFSNIDQCAHHIKECLGRSDVDFEQPHFRERLRERDITMRQVLSTLQRGRSSTGRSWMFTTTSESKWGAKLLAGRVRLASR